VGLARARRFPWREVPAYAAAQLAAASGAGALLTAVPVVIVLGTTDRHAPVGFAPLAIGLSLTTST